MTCEHICVWVSHTSFRILVSRLYIFYEALLLKRPMILHIVFAQYLTCEHICVWVSHTSFRWRCGSRDSFICVTWLIHVCDMTHSCVWHDSFICVWVSHTSFRRRCVWRDSFICVTWLIHMCRVIVEWLIHVYTCGRVVTGSHHVQTRCVKS